MNRFINYALDESGSIRHVTEVESGLDCNCICPACSDYLIAKNTYLERRPHFSHSVNRDCKSGYERSLILLAITILRKRKRIRVPAGASDYKFNNQDIFPVRDLNIIGVKLDKQREDVFPHINLTLEDGSEMNVDILVTTSRDEEMVERIKASGIATLEINFNDYLYQIDEEEFEHKIVEQLIDKKWLYYKEEVEVLEKISAYAEEKENYYCGELKYIKYCPLRISPQTKSSLNLVDENTCIKCPFSIKCRQTTKGNNVTLCLGHYEGIENVNTTTLNDFLRAPVVKETYTTYDKKRDIQPTTIVKLWQENPDMRPLVIMNNFSNRIYEISMNPIMTLLKHGEVYGIIINEKPKSADVVYFHSRDVWTLKRD